MSYEEGVARGYDDRSLYLCLVKPLARLLSRYFGGLVELQIKRDLLLSRLRIHGGTAPGPDSPESDTSTVKLGPSVSQQGQIH